MARAVGSRPKLVCNYEMHIRRYYSFVQSCMSIAITYINICATLVQLGTRSTPRRYSCTADPCALRGPAL